MINQDSPITMANTVYGSKSNDYKVVFMEEGGIHIYYQPDNTVNTAVTTKQSVSLYWSDGYGSANKPYTFTLKNDGVIEIKDSTSAVMFTNSAEK